MPNLKLLKPYIFILFLASFILTAPLFTFADTYEDEIAPNAISSQDGSFDYKYESEVTNNRSQGPLFVKGSLGSVYFDTLTDAAKYINSKYRAQDKVELKVLEPIDIKDKVIFNCDAQIHIYAEQQTELMLETFQEGVDYMAEPAIEVTGGALVKVSNLRLNASHHRRNELVLIHGANSQFILDEGTWLFGNHPKEEDANYGSAVKAEDGATFIMNKGSKISHCSAAGKSTKTTNKGTPYDGTIFIGRGTQTSQPSTFIMNGGEISNNKANTAGGAIFCCEGSRLEINGGSISNNQAADTGGAIYQEDSQASLENCSLSGNQSYFANLLGDKSSGGAIHCTSSTLSIKDNTEIKDNFSAYGGGISLYDNSLLTIEGGLITSNTSSSYGGNIYVGPLSQCTQKAGIISQGTANYGAGLYLDNGIYTLMDGKILSNKALKNGGGVFIYNGSKMIMKGGEVSANTATGEAGAGTYFGKTGKGGGINVDTDSVNFNQDQSSLVMTGGKIHHNHSRIGGGVFVSSDTKSPIAQVSGSSYIWDNTSDESEAPDKADNLYGNYTSPGIYGKLEFADFEYGAKVGVTYPGFMKENNWFAYPVAPLGKIKNLQSVINDENHLFAYKNFGGEKIVWKPGYELCIDSSLNIFGYPQVDDEFNYTLTILNTKWRRSRDITVNGKTYEIEGKGQLDLDIRSPEITIYCDYDCYQDFSIFITQKPKASNVYDYTTTHTIARSNFDETNGQGQSGDGSVVRDIHLTMPLTKVHFINTLIDPSPTGFSLNDEPWHKMIGLITLFSTAYIGCRRYKF